MSAWFSSYGLENIMLLAMDLDLLEKTIGKLAVRLAAYRKRIAQTHNKKWRPSFDLGDLAMKKIQGQG